MELIWKLKVILEKEFTLKLPLESKILSVQTQRNEAWIWAQVDVDRQEETRAFQVIPTGERVCPSLDYIGTFQLNDGYFSGHLYERKL
jgi:hypothetical protein